MVLKKIKDRFSFKKEKWWIVLYKQLWYKPNGIIKTYVEKANVIYENTCINKITIEELEKTMIKKTEKQYQSWALQVWRLLSEIESLTSLYRRQRHELAIVKPIFTKGVRSKCKKYKEIDLLNFRYTRYT